MKKDTKFNPVFVISLILIAVMAIWSVAFNENFTMVANATFAVLTGDFGWLFLLSAMVFIVFVGYAAFGKYKHVKLGGDDSVPEYGNFTWFGLLFGCGMGVGLVFFGVAEPLTHFLSPPGGLESGSQEAANFAVRSFIGHWGIIPWATYAVIGLCLAYFMYRKNKKGLVSVLLEPLCGEKAMSGWLGKLVDILAVFATAAGVVTSLGLGTLQINAGLNFLFGVPINIVIQIAIVVVVSIIYISSAVSGIDKGIKIISDTNLIVAVGLLIVCFLVGPKIEILNSLVNSVGEYIGYFIPDAMSINSLESNAWLGGWRVFYWAWFIAWGPFVGVFIARISKGRTIQEFVLGVVLIPTVAAALWGAVFGNLGIHVAANGLLPMEQLQAIIASPETGLFIILQQYPLGFILSIVAIISLAAFFVTSANSGVYVLSMLTSKGNINPPNNKKIMWGIIQSVMAIGLLMAGGLQPLQTISLAAAFPFIAIMFAVCASFVKAIKKEKVPKEKE